MEHIQDIYAKKPEMIEKLFDHLTKVDFNITGKSFHVFYNESKDDLEYHTNLVGDDNTSVSPIDVIDRLFSESIDNAINHIEERKEAFKNYIFLSLKIISENLFLTSAITKNNRLVDDPDELSKISEELEIDIIPAIHQGNLSESQKEKIIEALSNNVSPNDKDFIKDLFGDDIEISENYNGFVFSYDVGGKIVKYDFSDEQSSNILENKIDESKLQTIYDIFVDWAKDNASKLDNNSMESIELNFIEMMEDPKRFNKLMGLATELTTSNIDKDHSLQLDKVCENLRKNVQRHGKVYELLYENFLRLFWKEDETVNEEKNEINFLNDRNDLVTYLNNKTICNDNFIEKIVNYVNGKIIHKNGNKIKTWLTKKVNDNIHIDTCYDILEKYMAKYNCYIKILNLANKQMSTNSKTVNKYSLKLESFDGVTKINLNDIISNIPESVRMNEEFYKSLFNTDIAPQPQMGKGELLLKILAKFNSKVTNGDFQIQIGRNTYASEFKNLTGSVARLGNAEKALSYPTFILNKIKHNSFTNEAWKELLENNKNNNDLFSKEKIELCYTNFAKIPNFKNFGVLVEILCNKINNCITENPDIQHFKNIWMTYYMLVYCFEENFDIFSFADNEYNFYFINLIKYKKNLDENKFDENKFDELYELLTTYIECSTIRFDSRKNAIIKIN